LQKTDLIDNWQYAINKQEHQLSIAYC
jgi:hypothetical protein